MPAVSPCARHVSQSSRQKTTGPDRRQGASNVGASNLFTSCPDQGLPRKIRLRGPFTFGGRRTTMTAVCWPGRFMSEIMPLVLVALTIPILAIVALVMAISARARVNVLEQRLAALERRPAQAAAASAPPPRPEAPR